MQDLLVLRNISKSFGTLKVLDNISLTIESASIHALIGVNGAGKSTLAKIIMGLYQKDNGEIEILGKSSGDLLRAALQQVVYFGNDILNPALTVRENFALACLLSNADRHAWESLAAYFDLIAKLNEPVGKLSKGFKQRMLLVLALMQDKALYILDEPFVNLDAINVHRLKELIFEKNTTKKQSFLICSHNFHLLQELADKFTFLQAHKIAKVLSKLELEQLAKPFYHLSTNNNRQAIALLNQMPNLHNLTLDKQQEITFSCLTKELDYARLNELLYTNKLYIHKLSQADIDLEQYIYELYEEK